MTPTWEYKINQALRMIRKSRAPIAKKIIHVIDEMNINFLPYSKITKEDYYIFLWYARSQEYLRLSGKWPFTRTELKVINNKYFGHLFENRMYISNNQSIREMAKTIIRELRHLTSDESSKMVDETHELKLNICVCIAEKLLEGYEIADE